MPANCAQSCATQECVAPLSINSQPLQAVPSSWSSAATTSCSPSTRIGGRDAAASDRGGPQCREQRCCRFFEEEVLTLVADLDERDIGEAGFPVGAHRVDDRVEIGATGNGLGDILRTHELGGPGESGGGRKVGVHIPASAEPPEL